MKTTVYIHPAYTDQPVNYRLTNGALEVAKAESSKQGVIVNTGK